MELLLLPIPLVGHLNSMVEMAQSLLVHNPNFTIRVLIMTTETPLLHFNNPYIQSLISSISDPSIRFEELPPLDALQPMQTCTDSGQHCSVYMELHKPHLKAAMSRLITDTTKALIIDFFASTMIDVADEFGLPTYLYFMSNAATLMMMLYTPVLSDQQKRPADIQEFAVDDKIIEVPGLLPIPLNSIPIFMLKIKDDEAHHDVTLYIGQQLQRTKGMILNTCTELEPTVVQALSDGLYLSEQHRIPARIYTVGPVLVLGSNSQSTEEQHECIKWLDEQPRETVVFLCFGSITTFNATQIKEMALGLESSDQRFLWSLRLSDDVDKLDEVLPRGFMERTNDRGLVWPSWVPQAQILSHKAIGGFVSHCGWNSCLESLWFGVPLLAWPQTADQHLTAFHLVRSVGVAVELRVDRMKDNFVSAGELQRGLRCLMEDNDEVRGRVKEMKVACRKAIERGGSSYACLEKLVVELANA